MLENQLWEVLICESNKPDLHYTAYRLQKGKQYTGIVKTIIRRGNAPYETRYCYRGAAYKTKEEVESEFAKFGFEKRKNERSPH